MTPAEVQLLGYREVRQRVGGSAAVGAELPVGHRVSLPLPTMRWGVPAHVVFAGGAARRRDEPVRWAAPDRWWAVDARTGALLLYASTAVLPIPDGGPGTVVLPRDTRSVAQAVDDLAVLDQVMDAVLPAFIDRDLACSDRDRRDLAELLAVQIPEIAAHWYRAVAPDLFTWLGAGEPPA